MANSTTMTLDAAPVDQQGWQVPAYDVTFWQGPAHRRAVLIPVINEGARIHSLLGRMRDIGVHETADVVIVDGGSTDGSLEPAALQALGVRGLLVKRGPGRLSAQLRCGYAFLLAQGYEGIVTIDGNDKDDPAAIPAFFRALEQGIDFAQASRFIAGGVAENTPASRDLAIRLIHAPMLSVFSGFRWTDTTQGFRGYSRRMLLDPRIAPFRDVFVAYELLAYLSYRAPKLGYRCVEIPTARRYPKDGKVPTKISSVRGNFDVLKTLFNACFGRFDPPAR
ncbi:MAG TPA: glycosyltransferase [Burkholderiaceae bacterium]|nr:glycosyltransferase [Burkholderiaceae bacterium]